MQVPFDWKTKDSADRADFVDAESAPFRTYSNDEAVGNASDGIILADIPREAAIWREPFEVEDRIFLFGCRGQSRNVADDVVGKKIVSR